MLHYKVSLHIVTLFFIVVQPVHAQVFSEKNIGAFTHLHENYGNAVADYDQDGDLDIFIVGYKSFERNNPESWSRLFENKGLGRLQDVTTDAGLSDQYTDDKLSAHKIGASWGDYNGDGFPDLFMTHANSFQLFENDGHGKFNDITEKSKLFPESASVYTSALWWDYDNDSDLDLYISNYEGNNILYTNQGNGTFENDSELTKLNDGGAAWNTITYDVNHDGWLDLYVINDYGLSRLFINEKGKSFTEQTERYGLRNTGNGMGATIGDYNNDGHFDIYVTNIAQLLPNVLFTGDNSCIFYEQAQQMDIGQADWAWGTQFFDADHDMDEDLYVVNGFGDLVYENRFFKNMLTENGGSFIDWSVQSNTNGTANGMTSEVFDYDNDGDLDILVSNTNDKPYLYENIGSRGNWIMINLEGTISNKSALGSKLRLSVDGTHLYRYHYGASIMGQSIKPVHFGLSDNKHIDSLTIYWPNSDAETFYNLDVNQTVNIIENTDMTTSTKEITNAEDIIPTFELISFGPNPSNGEVRFVFKSTERGPLNFQLYTIDGMKVINKTTLITPFQETTIAVTDGQSTPLSDGVYIYRAQFNDNIISGKIIVE